MAAPTRVHRRGAGPFSVRDWFDSELGAVTRRSFVRWLASHCFDNVSYFSISMGLSCFELTMLL